MGFMINPPMSQDESDYDDHIYFFHQEIFVAWLRVIQFLGFDQKYKTPLERHEPVFPNRNLQVEYQLANRIPVF